MREIKNYPSYRITENGIVINIKTNKNVKQQIDKDGYLRVCLYNKNLRTKQFVHRLVATAFIPNPQSLPQVNHIDGNKKNNDVFNLEWVSVKQNVQHSYRTGLKIGKGACHKGEFNTRSILKETDVKEILNRKNLGQNIKNVYEDYKNKKREIYDAGFCH